MRIRVATLRSSPKLAMHGATLRPLPQSAMHVATPWSVPWRAQSTKQQPPMKLYNDDRDAQG